MIISDIAFDYLAAQVGELDNLKRARLVWEAAYVRNLQERMDNIRPHLPATARNVLDVGSGLGGIDVLLYRHYDEKIAVTLLDGNTYTPEVYHHNHPFSNKNVAMDFQSANGVHDACYMEIDNLKPQLFDLIVSFRAWCFHVAPRQYLDFVKRCSNKDTVLILDVRKEKTFWKEDLFAAFSGTQIEDGKKFERWALKKTN